MDKKDEKLKKAIEKAKMLQDAKALSQANLGTVSEESIARARQSTRRLNSEEKELLKKMIHEETAHMFRKTMNITKTQKSIKMLEDAMNMAIESGSEDEEKKD